ncbi:MAG TPA: basic secretory protein-like protein [bacterium]|nr:basic secretory protein-like protein [bacterium]
MLKIIYTGDNLEQIEKEVFTAFDFSYKFFKLEIPDVIVRVYKTRDEFNKQLGMETADWLVANTSGNSEIDILSPLSMEKESSHNKSEFLQILKHEFTHLFVNSLANGKSVPKWLNEGLAAYVAKQHQNENSPVYFEENFCQKLSTPADWDNNVNYGAYTVAALFVKFLVDKYSIVKINQLLRSLNNAYYYPDFKNIFFSVYGKELDQMEKLFINEANGK